MTETVFLAFAVGVLLLAGYLVLNLADPAGLRMGLVVRLAVSFLIGLGAVSLEMLAYSALSVPYGAVAVTVPWAVLLAVLVLLPAKREALAGLGSDVGFFRSLRWLDWVYISVIASQLVYAFSYAGMFPVTGWDSWQTWFFKAKVFFTDGGLRKDFFLTNELIHQDYPLLVPLSVAWVYVAVGRADEIMARLLYPLQFVSLLAVFYYLAGCATRRRNALLFTALLALTHLLMRHAADFPIKIPGVPTMDFVGYADLMLSACFVASAGFFYLYLRGGTGSHLFLFAVFLGLGAWTKDEGLPFAAVGAVLAVVHMVTRRRPASEFLLLAATLSVTAGPWMLYKAINHIPQEDRGGLTLANAAGHLASLPMIFESFYLVMFKNFRIFGPVWFLYPLGLVLNRRCFLSRPLIFLNIMLLCQFSVYILVYLTSSIDLTVHISTSIERVVLHVMPLAMFITAVNIGSVIYPGDDVRKEARLLRGF